MSGEAGEGRRGRVRSSMRLVRGALEMGWLLCSAVSEAALRKEVGGIRWSRRHGDLR